MRIFMKFFIQKRTAKITYQEGRKKKWEKMKTPIAPAQECVYFKTSAIRFLRFNFAMSSGFSSSSTNTFAVESLYSCSNVS